MTSHWDNDGIVWDHPREVLDFPRSGIFKAGLVKVLAPLTSLGPAYLERLEQMILEASSNLEFWDSMILPPERHKPLS